MKPGTQIIYVPSHANGDLTHEDCEAGFVTSTRGDTVFCRYWSKYSPGDLRTKSCSEGTPRDLLVVKITVPQIRVNVALDAIIAITEAK